MPACEATRVPSTSPQQCSVIIATALCTTLPFCTQGAGAQVGRDARQRTPPKSQSLGAQALSKVKRKISNFSGKEGIWIVGFPFLAKRSQRAAWKGRWHPDSPQNQMPLPFTGGPWRWCSRAIPNEQPPDHALQIMLSHVSPINHAGGEPPPAVGAAGQASRTSAPQAFPAGAACGSESRGPRSRLCARTEGSGHLKLSQKQSRFHGDFRTETLDVRTWIPFFGSMPQLRSLFFQQKILYTPAAMLEAVCQ